MTQRTSNALARREGGLEAALSVEQLVDQARLIQEAMRAVMKDGEHYGVIPGTQKPTLLKPGAEKLVFLFRLDPQYEVIESVENDRLVSYTVRCVIFHSPTGTRLASGMGQCNSREYKYRYRWENVEEKPDNKTVEEMKLKGLGRFRKQSNKWVWQTRTDNDNPMDLANTILKMASKRALIAGVLNATAASDIFTQDLEDLKGQETVPLVDDEMLANLEETLAIAANHEPKLWADEVVIKNATARFGRKINAIGGLTQVEAEAIYKGVTTWLDKHHPDWAEEGIVEAVEAEVVDSGDEAEAST